MRSVATKLHRRAILRRPNNSRKIQAPPTMSHAGRLDRPFRAQIATPGFLLDALCDPMRPRCRPGPAGCGVACLRCILRVVRIGRVVAARHTRSRGAHEVMRTCSRTAVAWGLVAQQRRGKDSGGAVCPRDAVARCLQGYVPMCSECANGGRAEAELHPVEREGVSWLLGHGVRSRVPPFEHR